MLVWVKLATAILTLVIVLISLFRALHMCRSNNNGASPARLELHVPNPEVSFEGGAPA